MTNLTYACLKCEKVDWETEKCTVYPDPAIQTRFVDNPKIGTGCHFAWEIIERTKVPVKIKRRVGQQKQKKGGRR